MESYDIIFLQNESPLQGLQDGIIQNISNKSIDCKSTFSFLLPTFLILKVYTIMVKYMKLKTQQKLYKKESLMSDQRQVI